MPHYVSGAAFFTRAFDSTSIREDLRSQNDPRQLAALHQVLAYMTLGRDMSGLFNEVAALTSASSYAIKRVVYLYLLQYSRVQPEKAVLQAGTFAKDTLNDSPLFRGAALRTMTSLHISVMADFMTAPLSRCCEDSDAYVKRAAAFGIAKQYCASAVVSVESGTLAKLSEMLAATSSSLLPPSAQSPHEGHDENGEEGGRDGLHNPGGSANDEEESPSPSKLSAHAGVMAACAVAIMEVHSRGAPGEVCSALVAARKAMLECLQYATEWPAYYLLEALAFTLTHLTAAADVERGGGTGGIQAEKVVADAEAALARVLPFAYYDNSAVVMAAVKVTLLTLRHVCVNPSVSEVSKQRLQLRYAPRATRALVTLLADAPRFEMRYVVLRCIQSLLPPVDCTAAGATQQQGGGQRGGGGADSLIAAFSSTVGTAGIVARCLRPHLPAFLIKAEDPIFIRLEKLAVLVAIATEENGARVLAELLVHTRDPDHELSDRSVRTIGLLAAAVPAIASRCVQELEQLLLRASSSPPPSAAYSSPSGAVSGVSARLVESTAAVVQTVLRRYPGQFLSIVPALCKSLTLLEQTEAKAAVAWVLGEYSECVEAPELEEYTGFFLDSFSTQPREVQLSVLSALAKIYARGSLRVGRKDGERGGGAAAAAAVNASKLAAAQACLESVIGQCVDSCEPDLRDRAFFYWRLLGLDLEAAQRLLSRDRTIGAAAATRADVTRVTAGSIESDRKSAIMGGERSAARLGFLESVLHVPARQLLLAGSTDVSSGVGGFVDIYGEEDVDEVDDDVEEAEEGGGDLCAERRAGGIDEDNPVAPQQLPDKEDTSGVAAATAAAVQAQSLSQQYSTVLTPVAGNGVEVLMSWGQVGGRLVLRCAFRLHKAPTASNTVVEPTADFVRHARAVALQINWNMFGLGVAQIFPTVSLEAGDAAVEVGVIVGCNNRKRPVRDLQVAIELEPIGVRYALAPPVPPVLLLLPATGCAPAVFTRYMKELPHPAWCMPSRVSMVRCDLSKLTANALRVHALNLVHRKDVGGVGGGAEATVSFFLYAETIARERLLIELLLDRGVVMLLSVRCHYAPVAAFFGEYVMNTLT